MGMKGHFIGFLVAAVATVCLAQPPPNDDFTNRAVLVGSSFPVTADTTGATFEYLDEPGYYPVTGSFFENGHFYEDDLFGAPSIWWSWTPTESSTVVVEVVEPLELVHACLKVYAITNLSYEVWDKQIAGIHLGFPGQFCVFQAQVGVEYQISVCSRVAKPLHFRWTSTNAPVFRLQPRNQTASVGQSVLFAAYAVGVKPVRYQWQKGGLNILNATNYMLPLDNCALGDSGEYRVVAASATGVSTSGVARLVVVTNETPALLRALAPSGSNTFQFQVTGEVGRKYRVEYSSDLAMWASPWPTAVIFNTNLSTTFSTQKDGPAKFVRVSTYHSGGEVCVNNLRQLHTAAWLYGELNHLDSTTPVSLESIEPYLDHAWTMKCPLVSTDYTWDSYCMTTIRVRPACVWHWQIHSLEED